MSSPDPTGLDALPEVAFPPAGDVTPMWVHWEPPRKFQDRRWLHLLLLCLTIGATTVVGVDHYLSFASDFRPLTGPLSLWPLLGRGLWYSATILAILGCHEMGHYLACRYYDVDASLPFFIPFPISLTGTLGAFIRIREPIPTKRILFDIGIAGPLAGFAVAVPALVAGLAWSHIVALPADFTGVELGEPLLFQLVARLLWGPLSDGFTLNLHPVAFAAWFGLLATALNLFPVAQLDGGHISYAVLGRKSIWVTYAMVAIAVCLTWYSLSWAVWTGLMVLMLWRMGPHHPPTFDEHIPLDRTRLVLAGVAALIFVLCFTPAPISPLELLGSK